MVQTPDSTSPRFQVLVIGGTGFLGRRIVEEFVRHGHAVTELSRGRSPIPVEQLQADRHNLEALKTVLRNRSFDVVVDNIAFTGADVACVLDVLDGRVGHFLLTSSAAVYKERYVRRPILEQDADLNVRLPPGSLDAFHPRLGEAYGNGKREAEQAVLRSGIPWTILRPPVVLGADDRTLRVWWFVQRLQDGEPILVPEWGHGRMFQVVWTHDVARAFVLAAGNPRAFGHAFNVAQAEVYTAESWIEVCADLLGARPRYAHVPEGALPGLGLGDYKLPVAGRPFGHLLLDIGAIRHELGFQPAPESVWLVDTLRGCVANPPSTNSVGYERRSEEVRIARANLFGY